MRIADAVEAVFDMACIVAHEAGISAGGNYHIVPTETGCKQHRHGDTSASYQREMLFAAIVLIGDGLLALLTPERDALAWRMGPEPFRSLMSYMAKRPALTRWVGATQIAVGIWWALRDEPVGMPRKV